jgi:hypothetical protein
LKGIPRAAEAKAAVWRSVGSGRAEVVSGVDEGRRRRAAAAALLATGDPLRGNRCAIPSLNSQCIEQKASCCCEAVTGEWRETCSKQFMPDALCDE